MIDNLFDSEKTFEANDTYFLMIGAEMASEKNIEKFNVEKSMDEDVVNENPEGETTIKYDSSSNDENNNHLSDELNSLSDINGASNATNSNFAPASEGGNNQPPIVQVSEGDSSRSSSAEGETTKNYKGSDKELDKAKINNKPEDW